VDITHEARVLATEEDLYNTEIKRSLGAGELISVGDLILKYKIKLGETIKVIVKSDSLEMEMSGVAQKNGRIGDKIPVRLASTRKDVFGQIQTDGRVAL
ncbi:MAG: flagellar basal body P-ring formation protein FlgA, partial [Bdellovibrionaceae bacterium]|nr:flagellar basal body P-ring formation protein FlgA [Pseudobdellovibrionaceae bacterium]